MITLGQVKKIYFVGIGGIAMSAAAGIAKTKGFEVVGSDGKNVYSPAKDVLVTTGIPYITGYNEKNIMDAQADLYILSAGETMSNPEVAYIVNNHLHHASFAELLYCFSEKQLRIVIAGTHGKSTTTGLLGHVLKNIDDSSFLAGAVLQNYQSNFYVGDGHYFVFEGDEYKAEFDNPTPKFHYYKADILVLTNLEYDHPDMFADIESLESEFSQLIEALPQDGLIVYNGDNERLTKLVHASNVSSVSFGLENETDFKVEDVSYATGYTTIEISNKFSKNISSKLLGMTEQYKIRLPGKINVYNAVAVIAVLRALGFAHEQIALEVLSYSGIKRRFEIVGVKNGITLVDDYAHHPTAVRETLEAARTKFPNAKIWAIFEPHTFSRTQATMVDLAKSFNSANEVLISEIYPAREKASEATITSQEAVDAIKKNQPATRLVQSQQEALGIVKNEAKAGDVVIIMAVGNFNRLAYALNEVL